MIKKVKARSTSYLVFEVNDPESGELLKKFFWKINKELFHIEFRFRLELYGAILCNMKINFLTRSCNTDLRPSVAHLEIKIGYHILQTLCLVIRWFSNNFATYMMCTILPPLGSALLFYFKTERCYACNTTFLKFKARKGK